MNPRRPWRLALLLGLAGCSQGCTPRPAAPVAEPHYVLGAPYQAGGLWHYPRERYRYVASGVASVLPVDHPPLTADGELYDAEAMAAAHPSLQLPAVARLQNISNGLQVTLRLNDRGPATPGRLLAVTPKVAELLHFAPDGTALVRLELDSVASQAAVAAVQGAPVLAPTAAPVESVESTPLAPPPGMAGRPPAATPAPVESAPAAAVAPLPAIAVQGTPSPGRLWIDCGGFGQYTYANQLRARLAGFGAAIDTPADAGEARFVVRIGPIGSVAEADALFRRVIQAGVAGAKLVVE